MQTEYSYENLLGQHFIVTIEKDLGWVQDQSGRKWNKVLCRPTGIGNRPVMLLDKANLLPIQENQHA